MNQSKRISSVKCETEIRKSARETQLMAWLARIHWTSNTSHGKLLMYKCSLSLSSHKRFQSTRAPVVVVIAERIKGEGEEEWRRSQVESCDGSTTN